MISAYLNVVFLFQKLTVLSYYNLTVQLLFLNLILLNIKAICQV